MGKKHSVVDYVFKHDLAHLYQYHLLVMHFMHERGYVPCSSWYKRTYRGQQLEGSSILDVGAYVYNVDNMQSYIKWLKGKLSFDEFMSSSCNDMIYPEHDNIYLRECLLNLKDKDAQLIGEEPIESMLMKLDLKCPFE